MENSDNPIDLLVAKFTRATQHEMTPVRGLVEECHTLEEKGRKIFIVQIKNGSRTDSFWLEHRRNDFYFDTPRTGDLVRGVINTMDDNVEFMGQSYKPIFDFENTSTNSEREAFAWFRRKAEEDARRKGPGGNTPD
jgi:hypothetical protein